ncbi:chemotaxis protein CheA [Bacillus sp. 1NLA3E]|uniref:chemotaxis protein CheA n=1 Tax=Bacillus sp. 1NLA3E TaxID=666686 RepID=UPI0005A227D9|nr:chemotaxis protein CheA [Bacillus sp. 1NLA3E]
MDSNEYLEMFIEESKEHLQSINNELLKLETEPENTSIVNEIFRSAHTFKGMAGAMGFEDLASLTHEMENVLDLVRNSKLNINSQIMDVVFKCVDLIQKMVDSIEQGGDGKENVSDVVNQLSMLKNPTVSQPEIPSKSSWEPSDLPELVLDEYQLDIINEAKNIGNYVYQIKVTINEKCVMKSVRAYMIFQSAEELGEIIQSIPPVDQIELENFDDSFSILLLSERDAKDIQSHLLKISEINEIIISEITEPEMNVIEKSKMNSTTEKKEKVIKHDNEETDANKKKHRSKSIRVDIEKLDHLMNLFSELIIDRGRLEQIAHKSQLSELTETVEHMTRISTDLQGLILNMRMVPVDQVFNRFPRMVRDLAKELNKKVQLVIQGADTELDRTVIDEIGDPLIHLLRNALDHGLESTEERIANGKPEEGTVLLQAYHSGNHVFIEVTEDGKGIDREKVLNTAIERGVVTLEEANSLTDQKVYGLLFSSGFSTAEKVTDISGRGVGLDVVKSKIESLGGFINIESAPGNGSTFRIQLPLTLSIIYSMLVKVEDETYAIPFNSIVEITLVTKNDVSTLRGQKVLQFRGQVVPLVSIKNVFHVPTSDSEVVSAEESFFVVIVRKGDKTVGLVVDSVIGQQEIVLKSLGSFLPNLYAISGATILGNGEVALIIDTNQFIN